MFCNDPQKFHAQRYVLYLHTLKYLLGWNFVFPAMIQYIKNSFSLKIESNSYFSHQGNAVYLTKEYGWGLITLNNTYIRLFDPHLWGMVGTVISEAKMAVLNKEQIFQY